MATLVDRDDRKTAAGSVGAETREALVRGAVDRDRDRIAHDLNETVIQRLFATGLMLQASAGRADTAERIERAVVGIDEAIRELRSSIFPLRRSADSSSAAEL